MVDVFQPFPLFAVGGKRLVRQLDVFVGRSFGRCFKNRRGIRSVGGAQAFPCGYGGSFGQMDFLDGFTRCVVKMKRTRLAVADGEDVFPMAHE